MNIIKHIALSIAMVMCALWPFDTRASDDSGIVITIRSRTSGTTCVWQDQVATTSTYVVQPAVVERPVYEPAPALYQFTVPGAYLGFSAGFTSYGGYYPTYWQYNSVYAERYNYRTTQRLYGGPCYRTPSYRAPCRPVSPMPCVRSSPSHGRR